MRPTASTLCPLSLPRKESVAVTLKTKLKRTIFREFPGYWWPFWTQHLSRYGARLFEEERRRWTILIFDRFRLVVLEQVLDTITVTAYGAAYISSSKYLWTLAFAARQNYRRVNANTLIGAAILFPRAHKMTVTQADYSWQAQQEKRAVNSCKILPETLQLQKRLNWAQTHLNRAYYRGYMLSSMKLHSCCSVSTSLVPDIRFLVYFPASSSACCALLLTVYPARLNCTNPCAGPECKIFTRKVTIREQGS